MDDSKVLEQMRVDWNQRAGEDAYYYVAFGRRAQADEEFFQSGKEIAGAMELELKRLQGRDEALEIGCGPGRLMRPLARHFRQIHGVDVSDEMVRLAHERLRDTPNALVHHGTGSDLSMFPDAKFDFVYSYAVFQHIPSREVVFNYLREAVRVLKPGGVLRCQLNGLPPHAKQYDTWSGVRITPEEIYSFASEYRLQLLALEQIWTQYMWMTCRKREESPAGSPSAKRPVVREISNALTGEAVAPASGPLAAISIWVRDLPRECDLLTLKVLADGRECRLTYIGEPDKDKLSQVNAALPDRIRTGVVPVELLWLGETCTGWVHIMPPGPAVPRIATITDGINLLSGSRIVTGSIKVTMVEVRDADTFHASIDGFKVAEIDSFCADPLTMRYEFNFKVPPSVGKGPHHVEVRVGKRTFPPFEIEVA
jgi:SAM-dependent methyltransferase